MEPRTECRVCCLWSSGYIKPGGVHTYLPDTCLLYTSCKDHVEIHGPFVVQISQKTNADFVTGYTLNLCIIHISVAVSYTHLVTLDYRAGMQSEYKPEEFVVIGILYDRDEYTLSLIHIFRCSSFV